MAVNAKLLKILKDHTFKNNETVTYTALNDPHDQSSITDIANDIYKTIIKDNKKDKLTLLNAIYDNKYIVVENTSNGPNVYGLVDKKSEEYSDLSIKLKGDTIEFTTKGTKFNLKFKIATPKVIEQSNWQGSKSKQELIKKLSETKNRNDLIKFKETIENILKTEI